MLQKSSINQNIVFYCALYVTKLAVETSHPRPTNHPTLAQTTHPPASIPRPPVCRDDGNQQIPALCLGKRARDPCEK